MTLKIEVFDKNRHNRVNFKCSEDSLDNYLRQQVGQDIKRKLATVFVLVNLPDKNIIGYYTLSAYTLELKTLDEKISKRLPRYPLLPATLIGRLAVDANYQGQGLGEFLLIDAFKKILVSSETIASFAVVVDAINQQAVKFYQKYGFQPLLKNPMKLYLPIKSINIYFP